MQFAFLSVSDELSSNGHANEHWDIEIIFKISTGAFGKQLKTNPYPHHHLSDQVAVNWSKSQNFNN